MGGACCSAGSPDQLDEDTIEQLKHDLPAIQSSLQSRKGQRLSGSPQQVHKKQPTEEESAIHHLSSTASTTWSPTRTSDNEFFRRLQQGIEVEVIPFTRTKIVCLLHLNIDRNTLVLTKDSHTRVIDLDDVQRVMYKKSDLQRVENHAALTEDDRCCAILLRSLSCIGLRFPTPSDVLAFVETIHDILSSAEAINATS